MRNLGLRPARLKADKSMFGQDILTLRDPAVDERFLNMAHSLGFASIARAMFINRPSGSPIVVVTEGDLPEMSQVYWSQHLGLLDPTWKHCLHSPDPFVWDLEAETRCVPQLAELRRRFGVPYGVSVPVHDANGIKSMINLSRSEPLEVGDPETSRLLQAATDLAYVAHAATCAQVVPLLQEKERPKLSARELDCLRWTAHGKTARQTSHIMEIAEPTVAYHLKNICAKLGASNKVHAVALAISQGQISLDAEPRY